MRFITKYRHSIWIIFGVVIILGIIFNVLLVRISINSSSANDEPSVEVHISDPHFLEGVRLHSEGQYLYAISQFDLAIENLPNESNIYLARATSYYFQGQFKKTVADLDKAIELDSENAEAYLMRGTVCLDTFACDPFDYEPGLNDLHRYLELEPRSKVRATVEETIERYESE